MATPKTRPAQPAVLSEFRPLRDLWVGPAPLFQSENAARWGVRVLSEKLAAVDAIAIHGRQMYFHPERVVQVIDRDAIERFNRRHGGK